MHQPRHARALRPVRPVTASRMFNGRSTPQRSSVSTVSVPSNADEASRAGTSTQIASSATAQSTRYAKSGAKSILKHHPTTSSGTERCTPQTNRSLRHAAAAPDTPTSHLRRNTPLRVSDSPDRPFVHASPAFKLAFDCSSTTRRSSPRLADNRQIKVRVIPARLDTGPVKRKERRGNALQAGGNGDEGQMDVDVFGTVPPIPSNTASDGSARRAASSLGKSITGSSGDGKDVMEKREVHARGIGRNGTPVPATQQSVALASSTPPTASQSRPRATSPIKGQFDDAPEPISSSNTPARTLLALSAGPSSDLRTKSSGQRFEGRVEQSASLQAQSGKRQRLYSDEGRDTCSMTGQGRVEGFDTGKVLLDGGLDQSGRGGCQEPHIHNRIAGPTMAYAHNVSRPSTIKGKVRYGNHVRHQPSINALIHAVGLGVRPPTSTRVTPVPSPIRTQGPVGVGMLSSYSTFVSEQTSRLEGHGETPYVAEAGTSHSPLDLSIDMDVPNLPGAYPFTFTMSPSLPRQTHREQNDQSDRPRSETDKISSAKIGEPVEAARDVVASQGIEALRAENNALQGQVRAHKRKLAEMSTRHIEDAEKITKLESELASAQRTLSIRSTRGDTASAAASALSQADNEASDLAVIGDPTVAVAAPAIATTSAAAQMAQSQYETATQLLTTRQALLSARERLTRLEGRVEVAKEDAQVYKRRAHLAERELRTLTEGRDREIRGMMESMAERGMLSRYERDYNARLASPSNRHPRHVKGQGDTEPGHTVKRRADDISGPDDSAAILGTSGNTSNIASTHPLGVGVLPDAARKRARLA